MLPNKKRKQGDEKVNKSWRNNKAGASQTDLLSDTFDLSPSGRACGVEPTPFLFSLCSQTSSLQHLLVSRKLGVMNGETVKLERAGY